MHCRAVLVGCQALWGAQFDSSHDAAALLRRSFSFHCHEQGVRWDPRSTFGEAFPKTHTLTRPYTKLVAVDIPLGFAGAVGRCNVAQGRVASSACSDELDRECGDWLRHVARLASRHIPTGKAGQSTLAFAFPGVSTSAHPHRPHWLCSPRAACLVPNPCTAVLC